MELLNLRKCKTNQDVCMLVSERVNSIPYIELLNEVEKRFIYQEPATNAIYTGLSENMNVFLSGPGGYGKSNLIKFVLDFYKIPYTVVVGYKDMPVDALLGIPDMSKLLNESKYEVNFKESPFYKPGILIGEEFTDILPSTAAALKDILTERGFHTKTGKVESLISCMIIAANKSSKEVIDDESKRAFYEERFPIQCEVNWVTHTAQDYFKLLKLSFSNSDTSLLFFMAKLFEDNHANFNNTPSPRIAIDITKVYINKGIEFISNFSISTENINQIKAAATREYNIKSLSKLLKEVVFVIYSVKTAKDHRLAGLHALNLLREIKVTDDTMNVVLDAKKTIEEQLAAKPFSDNFLNEIDNIFNVISND
jgi:hypothetical protein